MTLSWVRCRQADPCPSSVVFSQVAQARMPTSEDSMCGGGHSHSVVLECPIVKAQGDLSSCKSPNPPRASFPPQGKGSIQLLTLFQSNSYHLLCLEKVLKGRI